MFYPFAEKMGIDLSLRGGRFFLVCFSFAFCHCKGYSKWKTKLNRGQKKKKLCKEDMYVCPLNRDIYIYIYIGQGKGGGGQTEKQLALSP